MPKCIECNNEIHPLDEVCPFCGTDQKRKTIKYYRSAKKRTLSGSSYWVYSLISLIFPIIGLILLLIFIGKDKDITIAIVKGFIIGVLVWIIFGGQVIYFFI